MAGPPLIVESDHEDDEDEAELEEGIALLAPSTDDKSALGNAIGVVEGVGYV